MLVALFAITAIFASVKSQSDPVVSVEPSVSYPVEGEKVVYNCIIKDQGKVKALDLSFTDNEDFPYENGTGITIIVKKYEAYGKCSNSSSSNANFTTVGTLTFDSISLADITDDRRISRCKAVSPSSARNFQINVIPKESEPKISIGPEQKLSVKKGSKVTFTCNASTVVKGDVQSINIKWNFKNLSDHKKTLPVNARIALNKSGGQASSQLILTDVSVANAGVYYCSAVLKFKAVSGHDCQNTPVEMYKASTEIEKVTHEEAAANTKEEVEAKKGDKEVTFDCKVLGFPPANISWEKDDSPIDAKTKNSRYSFSKENGTSPALRNFTIKDLQFSDKGVYKCTARRTDSTVTKEFTLRVRDPLGALWPFIGIVAEAIVLVFIIGGYELYKKKQKDDGKKKIKNPHAAGETSPLVTNAPRVSYSGGDDSVRMRTANNEA